MKKLAFITLFALSTLGNAHAENAPPLTLKVYNADENSFLVTSTVVSGDTEALVIDTGFTKADALRIAANVLDTGKELKTILISNTDPDYYFGAETLKQIFPNAKVVTTQAVQDKIAQKMEGKLAHWSPMMGNNAPTQPILPEVLMDNRVMVDGQVVEVLGTTGVLAHRPYVWIPSIKTITGNIAVFGDNMHVWMADTQTKAERGAWAAQLTQMQALKPTTVIAGHMATGAKLDKSAIAFTAKYIADFETAVSTAKSSDDIINQMKSHYPNLHEEGSLELGAKVISGEMAWE